MKTHLLSRQLPASLAAMIFSIFSAVPLVATPQLPPEGAAEIAEFIQMDMGSDSEMQGAELRVRIEGGIAILTGRALSLAQVERATTRAIASAGVRAVVNQMRVLPEPAELILENARAALKGQTMAVTDEVEISESGNRILLSGRVGTEDERELVRDLLAKVPGVLAVDNQLEVTFEGIRTDEQIEEQLKFLINSDPLYAGLELVATVSSGKVKLSGMVGNRGEFDRLVRRSHVTGVFEVQNAGLNIDRALAMEGLMDKVYTSEESLAALKDALGADERIEASMIEVEITDGFVTLGGTVRSVAESDAVELTARGIPSVLRVTNELKIMGDGQLAGTPAEFKAASPPTLRLGD